MTFSDSLEDLEKEEHQFMEKGVGEFRDDISQIGHITTRFPFLKIILINNIKVKNLREFNNLFTLEFQVTFRCSFL